MNANANARRNGMAEVLNIRQDKSQEKSSKY
jgi:hypothetical protein